MRGEARRRLPVLGGARSIIHRTICDTTSSLLRRLVLTEGRWYVCLRVALGSSLSISSGPAPNLSHPQWPAPLREVLGWRNPEAQAGPCFPAEIYGADLESHLSLFTEALLSSQKRYSLRRSVTLFTEALLSSQKPVSPPGVARAALLTFSPPRAPPASPHTPRMAAIPWPPET